MSNSNWKIMKNTDSVDIDQKCLGLSPRRDSIPQDVADYIHKNRGLHIQIRHNGDPQTFAQANDLLNLISAAPELLSIAEAYRNLLKTMAHTDGEVATYNHIDTVLIKIRGSK